jgi:hypothetical protein
MEFHRVYARWDEGLWLGAAEYAKHRELTPELEYVTLEVARPGNVCLIMSDKVLCDYGPEHDHDRP